MHPLARRTTGSALMTDELWDILAEAAKWARANEDVLVDAHWVGGNPGDTQVYGVAGLRVVLAGLLALPESLTMSEQRDRWQRLLGEVKELPIAEEAGKRWLKPAYVFSEKRNAENPELYAVFPYPIYGIGKPDLEIGRETYARRGTQRTGGWQQDAIQAALLGLPEQAKNYLLQNVTTENLMGKTDEVARRPDSRFPAFWGPNFDWISDQCNASVILITLQRMLMQTDGKVIRLLPAFWGPNFDWTPDQCHGSVTLIALQRMLMLCDGDRIRLLPAWPKEWNADFKLHAPHNTTVEGRVENGQLIDLNVTPESRRKDVVIGDERF